MARWLHGAGWRGRGLPSHHSYAHHTSTCTSVAVAPHPQAVNAGGVNAISIQYHCGLDATILVSKNSGRYRVQSTSFEGLWLLSDE